MLDVFLLLAFTRRGHVCQDLLSLCDKNACVHRLDVGFYSHLKEFWEIGVKTHISSKGRIPSTGGSEEGRTCDAASHRTASTTITT